MVRSVEVVGLAGVEMERTYDFPVPPSRSLKKSSSVSGR